jgi:hypothetical protein
MHISKELLKVLKSKTEVDMVYSNIEGNNNNNNNDNNNNGHLVAQETDVPKLTLNEEQLSILDEDTQTLYIGLKCNPIKCTHKIICIVHSSDQRKQVFKNVIKTRNQSGWFKSHNNKVMELPDLELLCDVKT